MYIRDCKCHTKAKQYKDPTYTQGHSYYVWTSIDDNYLLSNLPLNVAILSTETTALMKRTSNVSFFHVLNDIELFISQ